MYIYIHICNVCRHIGAYANIQVYACFSHFSHRFNIGNTKDGIERSFQYYFFI